MKPDFQSAESAKAPKDYASFEEVESAIKALTNEDHAKLMLIARSFCKRRKLSLDEMEPEELLSEAILATCRKGGKQWNTSITMVRHLDRAMENISGHFVKKRKEEREKVIAFPDGLRPHAGPSALQTAADDTGAAEQEAHLVVKAVFGNDEEARQVFLMRVEEAEVSEILLKLNLTETRYETIRRRILRRIAKFVAEIK